ncbi:hypothetical protein PVAND_000090 [Polypedilum vanderplanki]|uniref:Nose resistant-to-fluoxetine protein N-terminal domain-containing protein n=1 Tax=Polypedilum vanderplanki TaxID=319348 RepID=A0A9J6BJ05_POLVA|nr:hypothetical protein PVAND_000090 [Polypedilum vanderplanki]
MIDKNKFCSNFLKNFDIADSFYKNYTQTFSDFQSQKNFANSHDFGDFTKCIELKDDEITGKYCLIQYYSTLKNITFVKPAKHAFNLDWENLDKSFSGAICIPSICNVKEFVPKLMEKIFANTSHIMATDYEQENLCQIKEKFEFNFDSIFGLFLVFTFTSIILGNILNEINGKKSLGIIKNFKNLFDINQKFDEEFEYMAGYKAILTIVTIITHFLTYTPISPVRDSSKLQYFYHSIFRLFVAQVICGVAQMIAISTIFQTKYILKCLERGKLNVFLMIIDRILRILPSIIILLLLEKYVMQSLVGKFFQAPYLLTSRLEKLKPDLWTPLTYFQNYLTSEWRMMNIANIYYYSVDLHYFILTPIFIYILWKWKQSKFLIYPVLLAISLGFQYNYILRHRNDFENMIYFMCEEKVFSTYYQQTHFLMDGWIIGMWFGNFVHENKTLEKVNLKNLNLP